MRMPTSLPNTEDARRCRAFPGVLLSDEARRMAMNFARLPELLAKPGREGDRN
jgi:hypothetical protein